MERFQVLYVAQPRWEQPLTKDISCIDGHVDLVPYLSIGENLTMGCPGKIRKNHQLVLSLLQEIHLKIDLDLLPEDLDYLQKVLLQMTRSLLQGKHEIYLWDVAKRMEDSDLHQLLQVCQYLAERHHITITLLTSNVELAERLTQHKNQTKLG